MGCTSTNSLTIAEHKEKKNEDMVANKMPKYEHEWHPFNHCHNLDL